MDGSVGQLTGVSEGGNYRLGAGYWYGITAIPGPVPRWFDTGPGTYPSIAGTHTGTITLDTDMTLNILYTYPSAGTGGHSEAIHIWGNGVDKSASWSGYSSDWQNITFDEPVVLEAYKTYYYSITTGSYPQIIHESNKDVIGGTITCTEFVDVNGKRYDDGIPAIFLHTSGGDG
jgi:hypothetical protein